MQKGKSSKMDLSLLKYDITGSESVSKIKIYCRKHNPQKLKSRAISDPV
jgi:hypothetical protein